MAQVGYSVIGASDYNLATTTFFNPSGLKVVIPDGGTVTKASAAVRLVSGSPKTYSVNIFNDSAGTRGSLIAVSNNSASVAGTYSFTDVTYPGSFNLSAGTYWLQTIGNPDTGIIAQASDTGGAANSSYFLQDNSIPQYGTTQYSVYLTYISASVVGWNIALK